VGGVSLVIHTGVYALLSRVVWEQGNRTLEYVIALTLASIFNFTLHRIWTFAVNTFSAGMVARYVTVILSSMTLQSILFHIGVERLGIFDFYVFFATAALAAVMQYFGHRFFTYNVHFEKKVIITETHEQIVGPGFEKETDVVEVRVDGE
jgi:putative flippase GtrA